MVFLLAFGCVVSSGGPGPTDSRPHDSGSDTSPTDSTPTDSSTDSNTSPALNGTPPAKAIPPPVFAASNMDGTPRTRVDLIGHPTIVWFYPAAATGG